MIKLSDGTYLPIMPVVGDPNVAAIGYRVSGGSLRAYDQSGTQLWSATTTGTETGGGYDFNSDGWPDVAVVIATSAGSTCGTTPMQNTTLHFYDGKTGTKYTPLSPMADKCWTFGSTSYPTSQWSELAPLWGDETNTTLAAPYYADTGWYLGFSGGSFTSAGALYYPSTSAYDSAYTNSTPNAYPTGTDYILNSHVANGLITSVSGTPRAVFWTSGRVVQYDLGSITSSQLVKDTPYLTGGRTDIGGRNYGLVSVDPDSPNTIALLAGTSNYTLFQDRRDGGAIHDPWGAIERHVTLYNAGTGVVDDRFFSYAHDNNDGDKYQYRVSYPAHPWVKNNAGASRLAYNVFHDGRWRLMVSQPGSTSSLYELVDVFLWDIVDLDGDGVEEWLISPTRDTSEPLPGNYYLPKWKTSTYHWNQTGLTLDMQDTFNGVIPYLAKTYTLANTTSSDGFLAPAHVYVESGDRKVLMMDDTGNVVTRIP